MKTGDNPLIRGIIQEAEEKAAAIESAASREAEDILSDARERAEKEARMGSSSSLKSSTAPSAAAKP